MRFNIALLHYSCPPVVGGVEEIIRQQASLFYRYHHPVKILAGMGDYFKNGIEIEIHPLFSSRHKEISKLQKDPLKHLENLHTYEETIFEILKESLHDFDILIAHNVLTMPYNLPLTMALHHLADSRLISIISWNHDSPYFYANYPPELDSEPYQILKSFNPNITYVTISESRAKEFGQLYRSEPKAIEVIPNGVDPIRFFRLGDQTIRLIKEENLFQADLILAQPSRLHPRKNIELSIEVLHALKQQGKKAKLLLTGAFDPHEAKTVQYFNKLNRLAEDLNVRRDLIMVADYTFKSGEKLPASRVIMHDLYLLSDILFLPSKQEGFGIPLLEAGMIKLPIACSNIPPFQSIAGDHVLYFDLNETADEIADKILNFLESLGPARWFRQVMNDYVWDNIYHRNLSPLLNRVTKK